MKISYNKLQTYLEDKLPSPDSLSDAFTFHVFEVESVDKVDDDYIMDIKVLPDRFCYAKSYEGIAREISTILGLKKKPGLVHFDANPRKIAIQVSKINEVLGSNISITEIIDILKRMDIGCEATGDDGLILSIPSDRLDLQSWRDIPEEIGRIYEYDKIDAIVPKNSSFKPSVDKFFYYAEKIKNIMLELGFSEVYTYTLVQKGEYEIEKPLAADKNHLRTNLYDGIMKSLELNSKHSELLGLDTIKIFEIGKVFTNEGERLNLSIGIAQIKKIKGLKNEDILADALNSLEKSFGSSVPNKKIAKQSSGAVVWECNVDDIFESLPTPSSYTDLNFRPASSNVYNKFSNYPFIIRDIAVFVEESVTADIVWQNIEKAIADAGAIELLERHTLFDTFKKDGKVSYAFRIIFQSANKTLTDKEVNEVMDKIYIVMDNNSWKVR